MQAAEPITPRSSRVRSRCRRSSGFTRQSTASSPGSSSSSTGLRTRSSSTRTRRRWRAWNGSRTISRPAHGAEADRRKPAATADGLHIRLDANIEFADDLAAARYAGAEGIGLYRSEFLLTSHRAIPTEEQQYEIYRKMLEGMAPGPVTVRTFDVDEDQLAMRSADPTLAGQLDLGRRAGEPPGPARTAAQPHEAGTLPHTAEGAASRGAPRLAAHHVPVRLRRRAVAERQANGSRGRG